MKKITLILGGIRSGKSYFAETKAEFYSSKSKGKEKPVYIATAVSFDKEMQARIEIHRKRRGNRYELIEAPYDIIGPLSKIQNRTVLVDCLTLNLSNRLLATEEYMQLDELIESDDDYLKDILKVIEKNNLNVIFVSNEVGLSPVEPNKLGRFFQDLQGRWNRTLASFADEVYMVQAGIPTLIKKNSICPFKISAPSYLLPTGYIENITYLVDKVDDIQLLLFDSSKDDPLFKQETIQTLKYLVKESQITFSAHMPTRPRVFDAYDQRFNSTCELIENLEPLNIKSFTFHFDLPEQTTWNDFASQLPNASKWTKSPHLLRLSHLEGELKKITETYIAFFKAIKTRFPGIDISIENTETPLTILDTVVNECGISYCIDIGHLIFQGWDLNAIEPRLKNATVVHYHGWEEIEGKRTDHRAIIYNPKILKILESYHGILTIENYHKVLFEKSLNVLKTYF